ncbi:MAG: fasciclin domain-containing protein [Burkholderiales bacterium]
MKLKSILSPLVVVAITAAPLSALAGASHIMYLQKKSELAAQANASQSYGNKIADVAKANGQFNTFLKAVEVAGLKGALSAEGPLTVFMPTDDAFSKLPPGQLDALLQDQEKLKRVLGLHIVPQKKYAWDLRRDALKTLNGETVAVTQYASPEDIRVNQVDVLEANIPASNGIIHAIDGVLLPKS